MAQTLEYKGSKERLLNKEKIKCDLCKYTFDSEDVLLYIFTCTHCVTQEVDICNNCCTIHPLPLLRHKISEEVIHNSINLT